ncbi:MAG: hypothetical protein F6K19_41100 [Cyanothece sp. SIO1E1]|nr:hypothetical protein [Cyanothece sp. SIO1E1]
MSLTLISALMAQVPRDAGDILEQGEQASEAIAQSWDRLWDAVLAGQLYTALANIGILFALATLLLFMTQWARQMIEGDNARAYADFIWPLLVIVLLANSGSTLAAGTLEIRNIINRVNQEILSSTAAGINLEEAYRLAITVGDAEQVIIERGNQCFELQNAQERADCFDAAAAEAEAFIGDYRAQANTPGSLQRVLDAMRAGSNPVDSVFRAGGALLGATFQTVTRGILIALHLAFQWLIEASMLLTATLGPLAVGGSLLPVGTKPLMAWLTGFFSLAIAKLSFNILSGIVSVAVLNAGNAHPLILPFFLGLLAPVLSLALASGGGMTLFSSLVGAGATLAGLGATGGVIRRPAHRTYQPYLPARRR